MDQTIYAINQTSLLTRYAYIYPLIISLFLVAFGQPAWIGVLAPMAAVCGFALFWSSIENFTTQKQFFISLLWFACVELISISWMATTEYHGVGILFVYVILSLLIGLQFAIFSNVVMRQKLSLPACFFLPALWVLAEYSRLYFLCGFSWDPLGLRLTTLAYPLQLSAVGGIYLLSYLVILLNLLFFRAWQNRGKGLLGFFIAICAVMISGFSYHLHGAVQSKRSLHVMLVQPGLYPAQKSFLSSYSEHFVHPLQQWWSIIKMLNENYANKADLIVLPEAVVPFEAMSRIYAVADVKAIFKHELGRDVEITDGRKISNADWAQLISNSFDADVIVGFDYREAGNSYNAALYFQPAQENPACYKKRVLVPLGEYLPFSFCRGLAERFGISGFFTAGDTTEVINGTEPCSLSICYDETFPELLREGRKKGAEVLINLTNDGWFPQSKLPLQHFYLGRVRAVENGAPLLRACNTGVTAVVDYSGNTVAMLSGVENRQGVLCADVEMKSRKTIYTMIGDAGILGICLLLTAIFLKYRKPLL